MLPTNTVPPASDELVIWRYMDFTKFMALLESKALFFTRICKLPDPFEGSFPLTQPPEKRALELLPAGAIPAGSAVSFVGPLMESSKWMRNWAMVSCWHASDYESAAMWGLYAKSSEAIAIRSTVGRLRAALAKLPQPSQGFMGNGEFQIGAIEYIDRMTGKIPVQNVMAPFFRKFRSFEYEHEIRALFLEFPITAPEHGQLLDVKRTAEDDGRLCSTDLGVLIESVFVAPQASRWYFDLVRNVSKRYGLTVQPQQSSLDDPALY